LSPAPPPGVKVSPPPRRPDIPEPSFSPPGQNPWFPVQSSLFPPPVPLARVGSPPLNYNTCPGPPGQTQAPAPSFCFRNFSSTPPRPRANQLFSLFGIAPRPSPQAPRVPQSFGKLSGPRPERSKPPCPFWGFWPSPPQRAPPPIPGPDAPQKPRVPGHIPPFPDEVFGCLTATSPCKQQKPRGTPSSLPARFPPALDRWWGFRPPPASPPGGGRPVP